MSPLIETIRASVIGDHEVMELPAAGKAYEYLTAISEAVISLAMIRLLLGRLLGMAHIGPNHDDRHPDHTAPTQRFTEAPSTQKQRTVNPLIVPARYNFLHSSSRPALRAAACGGRPRAGSDAMGTGEPASPSHQVDQTTPELVALHIIPTG
jgi:hypothetical protein